MLVASASPQVGFLAVEAHVGRKSLATGRCFSNAGSVVDSSQLEQQLSKRVICL